MNIIEPYNDDKLVFNEKTNQYELDMAWVKENFGNPFSDDGTLTLRIKRNTRVVYDYLFSHAFSGNRKIITAIINHTKEYREYIHDALFRQMEADCNSGYNDNGLFVGESRDQRDMQYLNRVCVACEEVLQDGIGYGGINLMSATTLPKMVYLTFMGYCK